MNGADSCGLRENVAVVTGSSSGIGAAIALELASAGADVVVHACRSREAAESTADAVRQLGRKSLVIMGDVSDPADRDRLVAQAWDWQGRVDVWVNNAGADVLTGDAAEWSFEQKLQRLWEVDVQGTVHLSRAAGRRMRIHNGVILNIGWDQSDHGMAGDAGEMFGTIKGAVAAFTKSLARSLAPQVRVNLIAPGWIRTAWGEDASDYWQQRAVQESLLQRWGTPEDVARTVRFLASPDASFITGQTVPVNGGQRQNG